MSTVALLLAPPRAGGLPGLAVLAVLALVTVVVTVAGAIPTHGRLGPAGEASAPPVELRRLLRANLVRTLAWVASTLLAAALLLS